MVFMDFPDLGVPKEKAALDSKEFLSALVLSEKTAQWVGRKGEGQRPAQQLELYEDSRWGRSRKERARGLHSLLYSAKKGDLIVIPDDRGLGTIHVGRFTSNAPSTFRYRYGAASVSFPARKVEWMGRRPWYQCTEELLLRSRIQTPFTLLAKSVRPEIYDIAFKSYLFDGEYMSRFDVGAEVYNSSHEALLQFLINYTAAHCEARALEKPNLSQDASLIDFITGLQDDRFLPELGISVNSPGKISLYADRMVPMVISALFALAVAACDTAGGVQAAELPAPETIEVIGMPGEEIPDECILEVEASVRDIVESMGARRWVEICIAANTVSKQANVTSSSEVERTDDKNP